MSIKPQHASVSPSELSVARACLRKWAFQYCQAEKKVDHPGVHTGKKLHAMAEAYVLRGEQPKRHDPIGEAFIEALPHLPAPRSESMIIEQTITFMWGGVLFEAIPDILDPDPAHVFVWDHKTSENPKAYGLHTKDEKANDEQTIINLAGAMINTHATQGTFRHVYYQKTRAMLQMERELVDPADTEMLEKYDKKIKRGRVSPMAFATDAGFSWAEITERMNTLVMPTSREIITLRGPRDPFTVTPNPGECDAFGGCRYKARCKPTLSPEQVLRAAVGDNIGFDMPRPRTSSVLADRVILRDGEQVLIDPSDAAFVAQFSWRLLKGYAHTDVANTLDKSDRVGKDMHRLLAEQWGWQIQDLEIDHHNQNKLDNRKANLRIATRAQQEYNKPPGSQSISGERGVTWDSQRNTWLARIRLDGEQKNLGRFDSKQDAVTAYETHARTIHGEFFHKGTNMIDIFGNGGLPPVNGAPQQVPAQAPQQPQYAPQVSQGLAAAFGNQQSPAPQQAPQQQFLPQAQAPQAQAAQVLQGVSNEQLGAALRQLLKAALGI